MRCPTVALLLLVIILPFSSATAQTERETFHLNEEGERQIGYAQAVRVGDVLYVSGTVGSGPTMAKQVEWAYGRLGQTLEHFGADFSDVVKETVFTTDMEALKAAGDVRRTFYGDHLPAATWVGVERLFVPELMVEIEVIADLSGVGQP